MNMIYTCTYKSPIGDILIASDEIGLTGLWFVGQKYFANTLNNTVVAPPRMLIAFLENNLQADGSVRIPEVLRPYMGGMTEIKRK